MNTGSWERSQRRTPPLDERTSIPFAKTKQTILQRVLRDSQRAYGSLADEATIQVWANTAVDALLTEQTRVTTFVAVLALCDIRGFADNYRAQAA